jgi:pectate lyase
MKPFSVCLIAFLVILLAGCQAPLIYNLAARPGDKLFWDDFSDGSGNWPQVSSPDGSLAIAGGSYRIQVLSGHYDILAAPGHTYRDVQVEADATRLTGPLQNIFGLACRAGKLKNYYFFIISSDGYYALGKIKNGKTSLIGQEMMAQDAVIIPGDGPNHLRFTCSGETLSGYVNGQLVASSTDTDFFSGDAGLVAGALDTGGVEIAFDNFVVSRP